MTFKYRHTAYACYAACVSQAAINMLAPLLFVTFRNQYGLSLGQISQLIVLNFGFQLVADVLAVGYVKRRGYRHSTVISHALTVIGLVSMSLLPEILPDPYVGLCIAVVCYGVGGGMLDVVVTPIISNLPGKAKDRQISLLNAAYSLGQMTVVALSTFFLWGFGTERWQILPILWALLPFVNMLLWRKVPIVEPSAGEKLMRLPELLRDKTYLLLLILMFCTGATVLSMSQWSSLFAEQGLRVPKLLGDLLGTCLFTGLTGLGRMLYGMYGKGSKLSKLLLMGVSAGFVCYLLTVFCAMPLVSLVACAACGFVTSLLWPGGAALGTAKFPRGGAVMYAALALAGDLGSTFGPWLVGQVSEYSQKLPKLAILAAQRGESLEQTALKAGLLTASAFPAILIAILILLRRREKRLEKMEV